MRDASRPARVEREGEAGVRASGERVALPAPRERGAGDAPADATRGVAAERATGTTGRAVSGAAGSDAGGAELGGVAAFGADELGTAALGVGERSAGAELAVGRAEAPADAGGVTGAAGGDCGLGAGSGSVRDAAATITRALRQSTRHTGSRSTRRSAPTPRRSSNVTGLDPTRTISRSTAGAEAAGAPTQRSSSERHSASVPQPSGTTMRLSAATARGASKASKAPSNPDRARTRHAIEVGRHGTRRGLLQQCPSGQVLSPDVPERRRRWGRAGGGASPPVPIRPSALQALRSHFLPCIRHARLGLGPVPARATSIPEGTLIAGQRHLVGDRGHVLCAAAAPLDAHDVASARLEGATKPVEAEL